MRVFAPPAITVRVVPTAEAPPTVDIDMEVVNAVQRRVAGDSSALVKRIKQQLPLEFYQTVELQQNHRGWFVGEVCFASIGWVAIESRTACTFAPRAVKGSIWAKRDQPMYPSNLAQLVARDADATADETADPARAKQRLAAAARQGTHHANERRESKLAHNRVHDSWNDWWD